MSSSVNILIIHGAYGSPEGNWFPWLKQELQEFGNVFAPQFPTPEGQNLDAWLSVANKTLVNAKPQNTILIGHSSGAVAVLRIAEKTDQPFKAVFSICPFAQDLGNETFDPLNASLVHPAFDWQAVRHGASHITCFAGDNDPYVPLTYSQKVANALNTELIVVPKGGHLNAESGYQRFPLLLNKIRSLL